MTVVVDNSVALAWALVDESGEQSEIVLDRVRLEGGHVPFIFRAEFANGLVMAGRRGRIDRGSRMDALAFIERLQLSHDSAAPEQVAAAMELAEAHGLTVYDALYLELAQRKRRPLATFDKALADAARRAGVALAIGQVSPS